MQEKKRTQFSNLSEEQKRIVSKKCYDITLACNFRGSLIKEKYTSPSSQFILDKAKYYVDNFASTNEKLEYLKQKKEYDSLAESNGIYYHDDAIYQKYILEINEIETMEELFNYIKGNNPSGKEIPIHSLYSTIYDRSRALGDANGIYANVRKKLLAYDKYKNEKRKRENQEKSSETLENNKLLAKLTLQSFLDSEFIYKQDYCKDKYLSVNTFDKRVANVKEFDSEFYEYYQNALHAKRQAYYDSLKPVVEDILANIESEPRYDIIDYYIKYKDLYTFEDLCISCNKYHLDIRALKTFFSKADVKNTLTHDSFMSQKYSAYSHEFTDNEKQQIFAYAKEKSIPTNWHNISLLVAKHYNKQKKPTSR